MIVFDIETNGLLDELDRIHLLTISFEDGIVRAYRRNDVEDTIEEGLRLLQKAAAGGTTIAGHNVIAFDIPAIQKVYPWFEVPQSSVFDTLVFARLKHPDLTAIDVKLKAKGKLPPQLYKRHSLEAWGHRLGEMKGEYDGDTRIEDPKERRRLKWSAWNPDMEAYGIQDVVVTRKLIDKLDPASYSKHAIEIEHKVQWIIQRQIRWGVWFNEEAAIDLAGTITQRMADARRELESLPGAYWPDGKVLVPKRDNKTQGYVAGAPVQKLKHLPFNPTSRQHVARLLKTKYGWEPTKFTEGGDPAIDDEVLGKLEYPEAKKLAEVFLLEKRLGQIRDGKEAWMRHVRAGRIHGDVVINGAVTGRMTHSRPNLAQVPKIGTAYGKECRALFGVDPKTGRVQIGADASGIELRNLGHYMARYDGGAYAEAVVNGKSDDETDVHSLNTKALGMEPKRVYTIHGKSTTGRNCAKTWIYAWLYGAGDEKLGRIQGVSATKARAIKNAFLRRLPALRALKEAVAAKVKATHTIRGLDGRVLHVRSGHSALNTLLQSAGALVMKQALIFLDEALQAKGYVPLTTDPVNGHYEFLLNVHDEWQIECNKEIAEDVGRAAVTAIRRAGEAFGFRCPLDGEWKLGTTWADTH